MAQGSASLVPLCIAPKAVTRKKTSFGAKKDGGIFVVAFVDLNLKNH